MTNELKNPKVNSFAYDSQILLAFWGVFGSSFHEDTRDCASTYNALTVGKPCVKMWHCLETLLPCAVARCHVSEDHVFAIKESRNYVF